MKTKSWREIRARKFPPEELQEIDRAVAEELRTLAEHRRAHDLATDKFDAVPADVALTRARGQSGPNRDSNQE